MTSSLDPTDSFIMLANETNSAERIVFNLFSVSAYEAGWFSHPNVPYVWRPGFSA